MGVQKNNKPFTHDDVANKPLVISMLRYEETLAKSETGQALYADASLNPLVTITVEKIINRLTLKHFGYTTTDADVEHYRSIFLTYYTSPTDYDPDVINSVHYMRENMVVKYTEPKPKVNDIATDCPLYNPDGTPTTLHTAIGPIKSHAIFAAFSLT